MESITTSRITSKHQLTLSRQIRDLLGVKAGDNVLWQLDEKGRVVLEPGRKYTLADIRAAVAAAGEDDLSEREAASVDEMKAGMIDHIRQRHGCS